MVANMSTSQASYPAPAASGNPQTSVGWGIFEPQNDGFYLCRLCDLTLAPGLAEQHRTDHIHDGGLEVAT